MKTTMQFGALLFLAAAACASTMPQELVDARTAYSQAVVGPASQLAPADIQDAKQSLDVAERSYAKNGDSDETKAMAYAAQRKAQLAEANARTVAASQQRAASVAQLNATKDQRAAATATQLENANEQLAVQSQQIETEHRRREDAERRATQAAADLARIASVKQEARGMVITLSGGVLFASGKSELLPTAQAKLSEVATALTRQDPDSKITVDGFTDSQGSLSFNQQLSAQRAQVVRDYLTAHGVANDRITSEGFGPARPVADNATAEGRADNRRVEIIVQPAQGASQGIASPQR